MSRDTALLDLLRLLAEQQYRFVTPTPLTHSRVLARRPGGTAQNLTDIFGWSLPFVEAVVGEALIRLMREAQVLSAADGVYRSAIRVSSLDGSLFVHSAYPTAAADSIFLGPDTYRFARFVKAHLPSPDRPSALRCIDIGCGSGAGGISAALHLPDSKWWMADINAEALRLTAVNARHAGVAVEPVLSDVLHGVESGFDLVISNPPYLADPQQRAYRHGGGDLGSALSLRIAAEACDRLNPEGRLLLYTGSAIINGGDPFLAELRSLLKDRPFSWDYSEIDPDVFGEELEQPAYASTDRIAAVGLVVTRLDSGTAVRPRRRAQFDGG